MSADPVLIEQVKMLLTEPDGAWPRNVGAGEYCITLTFDNNVTDEDLQDAVSNACTGKGGLGLSAPSYTRPVHRKQKIGKEEVEKVQIEVQIDKEDFDRIMDKRLEPFLKFLGERLLGRNTMYDSHQDRWSALNDKYWKYANTILPSRHGDWAYWKSSHSDVALALEKFMQQTLQIPYGQYTVEEVADGEKSGFCVRLTRRAYEVVKHHVGNANQAPSPRLGR